MEPQPETLLTRTRLMSAGGRFRVTVTDGVTALMFAVTAVAAYLWRQNPAADPLLGVQEELGLALMIEVGFVLMSATLVDIATRVRKRPPLWAVIAIAVVVFVSYGGIKVLQTAWSLDRAVLFPLILSLIDRAGVLWHLPQKTRTEKIGARALVSNRINAVLVVGFLFVASLIVGLIRPELEDGMTGAWPFLAAGALYFAIGAYDNVRVRTQKFAERPTVLFRFDPIHIEYLEPV